MTASPGRGAAKEIIADRADKWHLAWNEQSQAMLLKRRYLTPEANPAEF
jgi:hypothetical protein